MDIESLKADGFSGFYSVNELNERRCSQIPEQAGVYVVLNYNEAPCFLNKSTGGFFKDKNPTVPLSDLQNCWVEKSKMVYIGKAGSEGGSSTLHKRIKTYLAFGRGSRAAHWGGRYIWQLADSGNLIVAWKTTKSGEAPVLEQTMIANFVKKFGKRPFANLKD